jgi:hypothetical protein
VRQDAALKKGVELAFDEPRQFTARAGLGVRDGADRMLPHQAVLGGLLGAMALVGDRGAVGRLLGLQPMASAMGSRCDEPTRPQAASHA